MKRSQGKDVKNSLQQTKGMVAKGLCRVSQPAGQSRHKGRIEAAKKELNYLAVFIRIGAKQQEECAGPPIRLVRSLFSLRSETEVRQSLPRGQNIKGVLGRQGAPLLLWTDCSHDLTHQ